MLPWTVQVGRVRERKDTVNDNLAERIAIALEQIALEMAERNEQRATGAPEPVSAPPLMDPFPAFTWECPIHHQVKTVPAGVSARTGKPYTAFLACPAMGCDEKPPRAVNRAVVAPGNVLP